jgi:Rod binding domain-containing protein
MDGANLINPSFLLPPDASCITQNAKLVSQDDKKIQQSAKDFESVLLNKVLDEMKNSIGQWTDEEDVASGQVKGLFWLFLGRDLADKGGLGLWKDISEFFTDMQKKQTQPQSLDESL